MVLRAMFGGFVVLGCMVYCAVGAHAQSNGAIEMLLETMGAEDYVHAYVQDIKAKQAKIDADFKANNPLRKGFGGGNDSSLEPREDDDQLLREIWDKMDQAFVWREIKPRIVDAYVAQYSVQELEGFLDAIAVAGNQKNIYIVTNRLHEPLQRTLDAIYMEKIIGSSSRRRFEK